MTSSWFFLSTLMVFWSHWNKIDYNIRKTSQQMYSIKSSKNPVYFAMCFVVNTEMCVKYFQQNVQCIHICSYSHMKGRIWANETVDTKWILEMWVGKRWTGQIRLRPWPSDGLFCTRQYIVEFHKIRGISWKYRGCNCSINIPLHEVN